MQHEEHVAAFNVAVMAINKRRGRTLPILGALQDYWGAPQAGRILRKADDDDKLVPGDHGIPEIGRQEAAFFNALTDGQKDAYRALATMVETLFDKNKGWQGVDPWQIGEPIDEWKRKAFLNLATHPMQAYMVGQMLANEALESPIARPLMPTDRRAIEFLEHYAFNEIDDSFNDLKSNIRSELIQGMERGDNPRDVARNLANALDDHLTDWATIAITETSRADAQGRLRELLENGFEYAIGSSAHDRRTCDWCRDNIDGQVVDIKATIGLSNYGRKKADWIQVIPAHPKCRCVWLPYTKGVADIIRS